MSSPDSESNSHFEFKLSSVQRSRKFHFTKLDYIVRFKNLDDLELDELEEVLTDSFTGLIDNARDRLDDNGGGERRLQVTLLNEHFPGGQVEMPFVSLDTDGYGGRQIALEVERKILSNKNFDPT